MERSSLTRVSNRAGVIRRHSHNIDKLIVVKNTVAILINEIYASFQFRSI